MSSEQLLWTEERIFTRIHELAKDPENALDAAIATGKMLRELHDSYEARLRTVEQERDAALYTLMQHNPDVLAGDITQWLRDAVRTLEALAQWEDIDYEINDSLIEITCDEMAITIGSGDTAYATFAWPIEGHYRVQRRKPTEEQP